MNWQQLADLLEQELKNLFADGIPSLRNAAPASADSAAGIASFDRLFQKGIGRAVFEYTMTGQWPDNLTAEENVLLFFRLKYATAIARSLADNRAVDGEKLLANLPDSPGNKADLIQWLLDYAWDNGGHRYTMAVVAGLIGNQPKPPLPVQN